MIKINNTNYINQKNIEKNSDDILSFLSSQGIINIDDVRNKMVEQEKERLLKKHPYAIFFDEKDKRWKTTIDDVTKKTGRRLIAKRQKDKLIAEIISKYAQIEDEQYMDNNLYTLEKIFPMWLKYKSTQTDASSYSKRIIVDWNKFYKDNYIISIPITNLKYLTVNEWAHNIVKEYSLNKKQYYNMSIIIRQCLDYAVELGVIDINPFSRVKIKKTLFTKKQKPSNDSQVFLKSEQQKLCDEALKKFKTRKWCTTPLMILLNFQLGLRIGELVALKWEDIEDDYIHIQRMEQTDYILVENEDGSVETKSNGYKITSHTKSDAGDRYIYLNSNAKEILKEIKSVNFKNGYYDDGYIFIASRQKHRGTSRTLTKYLEDLCLSSGVTNKSNHKIRKTQISAMFDKGININTIREQAGHEDERTSLNNYCFDQSDDTDKKKLLESVSNNIMVI